MRQPWDRRARTPGAPSSIVEKLERHGVPGSDHRSPYVVTAFDLGPLPSWAGIRFETM